MIVLSRSNTRLRSGTSVNEIFAALATQTGYELSPVFEPARPGVYTLDSTGEQIVDPDYTAGWTVLRSEMVEGEA